MISWDVFDSMVLCCVLLRRLNSVKLVLMDVSYLSDEIMGDGWLISPLVEKSAHSLELGLTTCIGEQYEKFAVLSAQRHAASGDTLTMFEHYA